MTVAAPTLAIGIHGTLELPLAAVTETFAILGIRGSGKTNTAGVLAEELMEQGQQVVVVDPTDVWWGLKSSHDGASAGYPVVVMGGKKGDIPLAAGDGKAIADFVVDRRASVVLSTRHFESRADARRFITEFMNRLYFRKGQQDDPTPLMILIDECSLFVPQRVMGEDAHCVSAIQRVGRQGRSSGLGLGLIDQRGASVNKDVLSMVEVLICHRTTSPQDRKALTVWIEQHDANDQGKQFLADLASLPRGTAWVWSPGLLDVFMKVAIRERRTFDSSRTPKAGERVMAPSVVAPIDLEELRASLAATIEKAAADDPAALRKRIAELERAAREGAVTVGVKIDAREAKEAVAAAFRAGRLDALSVTRGWLLKYRERLQDRTHAELETMFAEVDVAERTTGVMPDELARAIASLDEPPALAEKRPPFAGRDFVITRQSASDEPLRDAVIAISDMTGPEQRVLDAIAWQNALGIAHPSSTAVALLAQYAQSSGGYRNLKGMLRSRGLIEYPAPGQLSLTSAGRAAANRPRLAPNHQEIQRRVFETISAPERRVLAPLVDAYPDAMATKELAKASGYEAGSGGFRNLKGRLRSLGVIDYPTPGSCRASHLLFPNQQGHA